MEWVKDSGGEGKSVSIYSIVESISGEVSFVPQGTKTLIIRLAGCNLRCSYCDTKKALIKASGMEVETSKVANRIIDYLHDKSIYHVLITGGEPLIQRSAVDKICKLILRKSKDRLITIETNGSQQPLLLSEISNRICTVFDYKLPSSLQEWKGANLPYIFFTLPKHSFVKFVCKDATDLAVAKDAMKKIRLKEEKKARKNRVKFALSPVFKDGSPDRLFLRRLLDEVLKIQDGEMILNLQIHKYIYDQYKTEESESRNLLKRFI